MAKSNGIRKSRKDHRGDRAVVSIRVPNELKELFETRANELGIPLSSWCVLSLSEQEHQPVPRYVVDDIKRAHERRDREREREREREEMPLQVA